MREIKRIADTAMINENYFVGLLWSDPIVNYTDYQSKIESDEFIHGVWKFYYGLGKRMYLDGVRKFDTITIQMKVKEYGVEAEFEKYGGLNTIEDSVSLVEANEDNIEYYGEEVQRNYIIRQLYSEFGDKVVTKNGKYDYTKLTKEQLTKYWVDRVNKISMSNVSNYEVENLIIDADDFIKAIQEDAQNMLPFYNSKMLNSITQGLPQGHVTMIGAHGNMGKSIGFETLLPTPKGWKKAKDIKLGDELFDRKGNSTIVQGVYPQGELDSYEVTLNDRRTMVLSKDHIVPYYSSGRNGNILNKTLGEMMEDYVREYEHNGEIKKSHKYQIPNNKAVEYEERNLPIHPYAVGTMIGDGSLASKSIPISSDEKDVMDKTGILLGLGEPVRDDVGYRWHFEADNGSRLKVYNKFEKLGLNVKSLDKFIPEDYLLSSIEQRMELLKGLMDSDGTTGVSPTGFFSQSFATNSEKLAEDVALLARSLGVSATLTDRDRIDKKNAEYVVLLYTSKQIVSSEKHMENFNKATKFSPREKYSKIVDIKKLENKEEMVCFSVDNDEKLFLMNDYIVTHNTSFIAEKIVMSYIKNKEKAIVVLNEESANDFRQKIVISILNHEISGAKGFDRRRMVNGTLQESDKEQIRMAFDKMQELTEGDDAQIKVVFMDQYNIDELENLVRYHANRGYSNLLVDTHKVSDDSKHEQRWAGFVEDAKQIYRFTRKEAGGANLRTILTFQLADGHIRDRFLTADAMSEGKASKNEASIMMMFRPIFSDEYEGGRHELQCHRWIPKTKEQKELDPSDKKPYIKEMMTLEKGTSYYLLFTPKNRFGNNTDNGQEVLVIEPNFNFNSFKEIGWTYVDKDFN